MKRSALNHKLCREDFTLTIHPLAKRAVLLLLISFFFSVLRAQSTGDTLRRPVTPNADTTALTPQTGTDSTLKKTAARKVIRRITDAIQLFYTDSLRFSTVKPAVRPVLLTSRMEILASNAYFNFAGKALHIRSERYMRPSYDGMFYLLVLMLFFFAIVKLFFARYLGNLLTLFFRASMRQQQIREQVLQSPFPSLLLNILFVFSGGLYGAFLLQYYHYASDNSFWMDFMSSAIFLAAIYLLKYSILRVIGWIFNITKAVETYLFVVFMTNKIIGIFLLPLLVLISFSGTLMMDIGITLSLIMIGIFWIYRFIASYSTLHKEINISGLHFFLYLCAFEIAPLVLIYKVLVSYLEKAQ